MPTYEYECMHCGHVFEEFQSISDEPLKECPQCKKEVRRLISAGMGIIFKGSGFYVTDNRKGTSSDSSSGSANKNSNGNGSKTSSNTNSSSNEKQKTTDTASGGGKGKTEGKSSKDKVT